MGPYQTLFTSYVAELSDAKDSAEAWWNQLIKREARGAGSLEAAEARARERWPFGPTSHPYVIRVYRKYFIACEQLNETTLSQAAAPDAEPSESDWGTEEGSETESSVPADEQGIDEPDGPVDPPLLLFEFLYGRRQDLAEFMMFLVFAPIGEADNRSV